MKIYSFTSRQNESCLDRLLPYLQKLIYRNVITQNSSVWINGSSFNPYFWVLNHRSSLVYVLDVALPGYIRITKDYVTWAETYDGSNPTRNPRFMLPIKKYGEMYGGKAYGGDNFTLVVSHPASGDVVKIIDSSTRFSIPEHGYYENNRGQAIIDLLHYKSDDAIVSQEPSELVKINAKTCGFAFLLSSSTQEERRVISKRLKIVESNWDKSHVDTFMKSYRFFKNQAAEIENETYLFLDEELNEEKRIKSKISSNTAQLIETPAFSDKL